MDVMANAVICGVGHRPILTSRDRTEVLVERLLVDRVMDKLERMRRRAENAG